MSAPLRDITVYYNGTKIKDAPDGWKFRELVNYLSDYYHHRLERYKPPNTTRICVNLNSRKTEEDQSVFGSICAVSVKFDEQEYLRRTDNERYKYILDLIHFSIIQIAEELNWDKKVFEKAYHYILKNDFKFIKHYPLKKSKDRKKIAQSIIVKGICKK